MSKIQKYPDELDMLQTFSVEPEESVPEDGYWCYIFDNDNVKLEFSFNVFQGSVQTVLYIKDHNVQTVSYEGTGSIEIEDHQGSHLLLGKFQNKDTETNLIIYLSPDISVKWASLVI